MPTALQTTAYGISYTSFLLAIASCALRWHSCLTLRRTRKADDYMAGVVGVSCACVADTNGVMADGGERCFCWARWGCGRGGLRWGVRGE